MNVLKTALLATLATLTLTPSVCRGQDAKPAAGGKKPTIAVTSKTVKEGASVPVNHTADGKDVSPEITWEKGPAETKTYAVTVEDPDAPNGLWFHWIVFNIPAETTQFKENMPKKPTFKDGTTQGTNDFDKVGYNGPAPPKGKAHHYNFKVFALDQKLDLKPGAKKDELYGAMKGHVVAKGSLTGTYQRQ